MVQRSRQALLLCILLFAHLASPILAEEVAELKAERLFEVVDKLNEGLPGFHDIAARRLTTPERTLSFFVRESREGRFGQAAYALNLNELSPDEQAKLGAELARKLYLVMDRQTGFPFAGLPDRSDGERPPSPSADSAVGGEPRKAYLLASLPLEVGQFEVYLMRFRTQDSADIWLFAPTSVDRIGEAFDICGPRPWESQLPTFLLNRTPDGTPVWAWLLLVAFIALGVGVAKLTKNLLDRIVRHDVIDKTYKGLFILLSTWIPYFSIHWWVPIPDPLLYILLFIGFCALIWIMSTILNEYSTRIIRGEIESVKDLDDISHLEDKRKLTYLSVGRRLLSFLAIAIGVGTIALKTPHFESVGFSLLASAGVVSVVLGVAAQPILGNIISGIQIAISRPIRVGDAILYEDDWCYVEEITYMYVLCRTWDERRLIVPLTYFISQPFSSYSLKNPQTMRTIHIELDYCVDLDGLRTEYLRLVEESKLWSENFEPKLEVLDFTEHGVKLRAIATADNAADAWDLHCDIREGLLKYLQSEQRASLPRLRLERHRGSDQTETTGSGDLQEDSADTSTNSD